MARERSAHHPQQRIEEVAAALLGAVDRALRRHRRAHAVVEVEAVVPPRELRDPRPRGRSRPRDPLRRLGDGTGRSPAPRPRSLQTSRPGLPPGVTLEAKHSPARPRRQCSRRGHVSQSTHDPCNTISCSDTRQGTRSLSLSIARSRRAIGERHHHAAAVAHEVVVVAPRARTRARSEPSPGRSPRAAPAAAAPAPRGSVDARAAHRALPRAQRVLDLHRRQRALLRAEQLQHRAARAAALVAGAASAPRRARPTLVGAFSRASSDRGSTAARITAR